MNDSRRSNSRIFPLRAVCCIALLALAATAAAPLTNAASASTRKGKTPPRDILGIRLNMTKDVVHTRLQKLGRLERQERKRQEVWTLDDKRFSGLIVGFDAIGKLRFVTVVARDGGQRVRYDDVADLKTAKQEGDIKINNFDYVWQTPARDGQPNGLVIARGRDPQYLQYLSLKRLD